MPKVPYGYVFYPGRSILNVNFANRNRAVGGGGGGGGQSGQDISQREKEIIGSTWKQQGDKTGSKQAAAETSKFLSGVQATLADQARSLSYRMQSRELSGQNDEFTGFVKDMDAAAAAMIPAADKLKEQKWSDAIPDEQKALQNLLRAEAIFRQIQVAFGSSGGGSGGGAGRDLASLFDLELDTEKNQYETGQTGSDADKHAQDIDDALKKLDELARREEELAQQHNNSAQSFEQRWQQEMLRRDAEELQRQLEQLAQSQSQGQSGSSSSGSSGSSSSIRIGSIWQKPAARSARSSDAAGPRPSAGRERRTAPSRAAGWGCGARRAADRLREAQNLLGGKAAAAGVGSARCHEPGGQPALQ